MNVVEFVPVVRNFSIILHAHGEMEFIVVYKDGSHETSRVPYDKSEAHYMEIRACITVEN